MSGAGKCLVLTVIGGLIVRGTFMAIGNLMDGKDVFGRKKIRKVPKKTYMDWKGEIVLGKDDFRIEPA